MRTLQIACYIVAMILAATGHRPDKLGGYSDAALNRLVEFACLHLERIDPDTVISGMAQGWDTAVALASVELGGHLIAAVPFSGQESVWPLAAQQRYKFILSHAEVHIVSDGGYSAWKLQKRNEWMVDRGDQMLALWNGSPGGTENCIKYADKKQKPVINLWADFFASSVGRH